MPRKLIATLTLSALVLAGCQGTGNVRQAPPPAPDQAPSTTAPQNGTGTETAADPWDKAREAGMAFRAIGNEPGWIAEVEKSRRPTLFLQLNNGRDKIAVPQANVAMDKDSGKITFTGQTAGNQRVQLVVLRGQCVDDMSGKKMDAAAELDVGSRHYVGCGRFLMQ